MESLLLLWMGLLQDLGERCSTSTNLDFKTAEARFNHEGSSFFTITLPQYCKDLEKGLDRAVVTPDLFSGFKKRGKLPNFLGGFMELIFDRGTGRLLEFPSTDSIFAIRQLTAPFGKIRLECSQERKDDAVEGFLKCELEVAIADEHMTQESRDDLLRVSALLLRDVFTKVDRDIHNFNIMGKHGPGATADRLTGNSKFDLTEWPARLEVEFPFGNEAVPSPDYNYLYDRVQLLEPGEERPVKITLVPKTLKTPRIIAIEPTAMQYMQQGLMEKFVEYIERDKTVRRMIGFTDQAPNQRLARQGSRFCDLATLDLREASDRVSNQHVRILTSRFPTLQRAVESVRSRKAVMPDKSILRLVKFASMGSALTFPFEAMVFLTVIFIGIEKELNHQLTRKDIKSLSRQVRVYGDDLVVPIAYVHSVITALESFGYLVNSGKSFWNGKFRESCGKEYYDGIDVSLTRCRSLLPVSLADVSEIISTVSLRNQLYVAGFKLAVEYLDGILAPILRNNYPLLELDFSAIAFTGEPGNGSPILGRQTTQCLLAERVCSDLHIPLVKGWHIRSRPPKSQVSGEGALLKWFLKRGEQPFADVNHLERSGRPKAVNIKLGWKPAY